MDKTYVHIDGDAFFVACEVARRPELLGLPVVVGEERGIVTALSYEAKAIGIKRGDPIFKIKKAYKNVTILQSHFDLYEKYSKMLYSILTEYNGEVEAYSVDECFMLFKNKYCESKEMLDLLQNIKTRIKIETGITYSFGVSNTKVKAKLASKHKKPDGFFVMRGESCLELDQIYKNKNIDEVWGIGSRMKERLNVIGIYNIYDFINSDGRVIDKRCGKNVTDLWNELRGINRLEIVKENKILKSLQATRSFTNITSDKSFVYAELVRNIEQAVSRLSQNNLYTNSLHIFIKTHIAGSRYGQILSTSIELQDYTRDVTCVLREVSIAFDKIYDSKYKYKKTGVTLINLKEMGSIQASLFENKIDASDSKSKDIKKEYSFTLESLKSKFGSDKIYIAASKLSRERRGAENIKRNQHDNYFGNLPLPYMGIVV